MADVLPISNPGDYKRAHQRIKKLWNDGGTKFAYHAQQRMKERKLDVNDIANCIRYGMIVEHKKPIDYWRYTILGKSVDEKKMKCVVEIDGNLIIVTVI
jgi:Domain of unknown function (DUF4258)